MNEAPAYRRIMSGEAGAWAVPVRAGLWLCSRAYGAIVQARNRRYDAHPARSRRLPVPVISVGNITTGGTGKTPLVIELVRRLQCCGRRPAVVARGYGARPLQTSDELELVQRRGGTVITVADPDRVAGGLKAVEQGADVVVLDDAFQHRRIHRDLDIVVIDATGPFGYGHLLPRGLLREPLGALARADLLVLSRTDAVPTERITAIDATLRQYNTHAPIICSRHHPTHLAALGGDRTNLELLRDRKVLGLAAIGNPDAFFHTLAQQIGANLVRCVRLPDHAPYDDAIFHALVITAERSPDAEYLVTTEKDLVKLDPELWSRFPRPIVAVAVDIDLTPDGDRILDAALFRLIAPGQNEGCDAQRPVPTD
ncbi:MAG: tetraacyldisaccharide 4'-kinase [Planctomycetota bacterium]